MYHEKHAHVKERDGFIFLEENHPEYEVLKTAPKSPAREMMVREVKGVIGAWNLAHCGV